MWSLCLVPATIFPSPSPCKHNGFRPCDKAPRPGTSLLASFASKFIKPLYSVKFWTSNLWLFITFSRAQSQLTSIHSFFVHTFAHTFVRSQACSIAHQDLPANGRYRCVSGCRSAVNHRCCGCTRATKTTTIYWGVVGAGIPPSALERVGNYDVNKNMSPRSPFHIAVSSVGFWSGLSSSHELVTCTVRSNHISTWCFLATKWHRPVRSCPVSLCLGAEFRCFMKDNGD